jgi:arginase
MKKRFILTPFFLDQRLPGLEPLVDANWVINNPRLPEGTPQTRMSALYEPLAELVSLSIREGELPVSVAGDCCTSIGILAGLQRAEINPTLLWFDAHGDFNSWETTPSGFLGGMPLAMLVGRGEQMMLEQVGVRPLPEDMVILSDGRDLDPGEREALADSNIVHLPEVSALLDYKLPKGQIWVHFDTDVIDAGEAPAMNYPVGDGPSESELQQVFSTLAETGQICAVSISAWNPELDEDGRSRVVSMGLLSDLIQEPSI